jgi:hypothetical protein
MDDVVIDDVDVHDVHDDVHDDVHELVVLYTSFLKYPIMLFLLTILKFG